MSTAQGGGQPGPPPRIGVLVSGGAPNLHLAAGALCARTDVRPADRVIEELR